MESEALARMSSNARMEEAAAVPTAPRINGYPARDSSASLFEQVAWLYAFCRERLFRDDTDAITKAFWPDGEPAAGTRLLELGCGPGFYSCRLAARFPQICVVGVDRSERQLAWARERAQTLGLTNCDFERVNVLDIPAADDHFDFLVASRLFTVVAEREMALAEMHRVLRPGGSCFLAEPRNAFRASVPLLMMWMLARVSHFHNGYREPRKAVVLDHAGFLRLVTTQPWEKCKSWRDSRYQYALCEKA